MDAVGSLVAPGGARRCAAVSTGSPVSYVPPSRGPGDRFCSRAAVVSRERFGDQGGVGALAAIRVPCHEGSRRAGPILTIDSATPRSRRRPVRRDRFATERNRVGLANDHLDDVPGCRVALAWRALRPHLAAAAHCARRFSLLGAREPGGDMPPDVLDGLGRELTGTSLYAGHFLRTIDHDSPHGEGAKQRKSINLSHAESCTHVDLRIACPSKAAHDADRLLEGVQRQGPRGLARDFSADGRRGDAVAEARSRCGLCQHEANGRCGGSSAQGHLV